VNRFAEARTPDWFKRNVNTRVSWPYPGMLRLLYPSFLKLTGFMGMNLNRHLNAHRDLFHNLIRGDGDPADKRREYYVEFLVVMDSSVEYYLQTIDTVFLKHALPKGEMRHRHAVVDPAAIRQVALMTVEGEKDDIS
jgi:poly(3-hydroxybutyrate) depolymerase